MIAPPGSAAATFELEGKEAENGIRDLMGLLALPALWAGRDGETILQITLEASERIVPLRMCYARVPLLSDAPNFALLRVEGEYVHGQATTFWEQAAAGWDAHPTPDGRPFEADTPIGRLSVVRLSTGYGRHGGRLWFGFDPDVQLRFTHLAFLRTAASLAATGIQAARANHERELASRAKDEFLAMLGHELRNPLTPIVLSLDLLKRRHPEAPPREIQIIERQAKHLSRLVDDLLDVTRITRGKVELKRQVVDLRDVIRRSIEDISSLMEQQRHTLRTELSAADAWVYGDETRLGQIFSNLLTNAAKYTDPGGLINVSMKLVDDRIIVSVKDNGSGISPQLKPRLFSIFEQGVATLERSKGGLGIGLALVHSFVGLHDGNVEAISEGPGQGSEFIVTLPLYRQTAAASSTRTERALARSAYSRRILLVDDNHDILESMREHLVQQSHVVSVTSDPWRALEIVEELSPEMAILDIGLPGMSGYELAAKLRQKFSHSQLRLVALTGYGQRKDRAEALAAGFDEHLVKPVAFVELDAAIIGMKDDHL